MRLFPNMGDTTKQVRVDNWGIFFLQRLQMFFSKTDYCDMTLQFEGNVQLKVHRLVMNACTEYFQFLEQTCTLEDNVIMMPSDLQADVIVPIVNFMYTGMLEFHLSIFDRLYKTAQLMNITILTKLLDAQKQPMMPVVKSVKKKHVESPHVYNPPSKKVTTKPSHHPELPATLPGRKLPVWKRKSIPTPSPSYSHSTPQINYSETKWSCPVDPLSIPDNTPKPTRFEWPEEDLPPLNPMDTSFEEISYTSKPLLTQEEEQRATTSFDDVRHIPNASRSSQPSKKQSSTLDMEEMKNYVKEQKIRSGLSHDVEIEEMEVIEGGQKRKMGEQKNKALKKLRFEEPEMKTTISIATDGKAGADLNHEKIVTEILKKYPQLVKKNKNIRLKIMAKNKTNETGKSETVQLRAPRLKVTEVQKPESPKTPKTEVKTENKAPWICERCSTEDEPVEFILYYLYRKHMTDVHNEKFDPKLCKYCGHRCNKFNLLMYHLYTKHGMKPPHNYNFPKCDQCPFIAFSQSILSKHKMRHGKNEIQCIECKLAFTSQATLTSHIQITGHTGKSNKNNYDCQYCTKRFQSGVNLFSHVKGQHKNEALRDGIVSIDEVDDVEDDEDDVQKDEYILPEIITESETVSTSKKVNILSNVKVQDRQEHPHHQLKLEPSSEAEALNNVATGIATSLGLVDIVVLNDNQQIFLQSNQSNYSNDQNEQAEFILPELTSRDSFTQNQNEVITTDGVITQQMLSSGDIGSTDELVMVLTDHDYGDNQDEVNNDNSNIVVLYSHPVDGQQDQFITSQGNIMVNSQGLIEIRNGATMTPTPNQVVVDPQETHIESIEMIQREIESHRDLKQETLYEEENKTVVETKVKENSEPVVIRNDPLIESLTQGQQLEFTSPLVQPPEAQDVAQCLDEEICDEVYEGNDENVESNTEKTEEERCTTEELQREVEVEKEQEAVEEMSSSKDEEEPQPQEEVEKEDNPVPEKPPTPNEETPEANQLEEKDPEPVPIEENTLPQEEDVPVPHETISPEPVEETEDTEKKETTEENQPLANPDDSKTDENVPLPSVSDTEKEESRPEDGSKSEEAMEIVENEADTSKCQEEEENTAESCQEEERNQEDQSNPEQEMLQSDTSTSQFNDENSQSSQEEQEQPQEASSTKISILDDWEDTDSQQSDQKEKAKAAGEAVHKLMDDWEEEEEDESRKDVEG